jgi:predicted O-methyltransferase YrrM
MNNELWTAVENYFVGRLHLRDADLDAVLAASRTAGLPDISVSPNEGKLLHLLARIRGARRILEIGTLGGYSAIWLARALPPDGRLITLELDPAHARVARESIARAGHADVVDIRVGEALDSLEHIHAAGDGPFELVFIDADKPNNPGYFMWAMRLSRPGTIIVIDNVVREGAVADASSDDAAVQATRRLHDMIAAEPRVSATAIQTVGSKGHDGFTLVLVAPA